MSLAQKTFSSFSFLLFLSGFLIGNNSTDSTQFVKEVVEPPAAIEKLWSAGLKSQDKGYFLTALSLLDSSLCLLQNEVGLNHPFSAVAMSHLGNIYYENGYIGEAYNYQSQALEIRLQYFGPQHLETAKSYNNLANCFLSIGDYERAIALYLQTAKIRKAADTLPPTELASVYNNLGNAYLSLGQWGDATTYYEEAFNIRQNVLGSTHLKTAQSRLNLGNIFAAQHQPDSALLFFEQVLPVYLENYDRQHPQLAALYENMGNALTAQQQYERATQLLEKAMAIRQQFYGEAHPDLIRSYQNIGELWLQRGDYQQAYQYFQYALDLSLRLWGEYHPQVAQAYEQVGLALLYLDKISSAKNNFQQAIALRQSLFGEEHPFVAGSWLNLGNAVWQEENHEQARQYFQQSLAIWDNYPSSWRAEQLKASLNICQTYLEEKQPKLALQSLLLAETYLDTTQAISLAGYWRTQADTYLQLKDYEKANLLLDKTLDRLQFEQYKLDTDSDVPPLEILLCLQSKGLNKLAWAKAKDDDQMAVAALDILEEAIDWLMVLQTTYATPEARQQISALHQPLFEGAIATCLYLAANETKPQLYYKKALVLSERNKSIRLLEANFSHNYSESRIPDSLVQAWQQTSLHLNQLEKQLALDEQNLSRNELQNIQTKRFYWQQKRNKLRQSIKQYEGRETLESLYLTIEKITPLQEALSEEEVILSFFYGKDQHYVFVLNRKDVLARQLANNFPWQTHIRDLGKSIIQFPTTSSDEKAKIDSVYTSNAQQLYQQLFPFLKTYLKPQSRLLIIPDGIFNYLPFEALLSAPPAEALRYRSYPYLINDYTISYAYSISQWLNDKQRSAPSIRAGKSCLAIAPTFDLEDKTLAPLEHNLSEAQAVLTQFPGKLLADSMASRRQFLANADEYAILHLATHALTNMRDGDYAYLVLTADSLNAPTPYSKLYVKDLYAQQWKAQLAVLSACETGIGNFRSGEGVISLARGFAQAGVRSTVSSLWQINDTQTALLMEQFYRYLHDGQRKDNALQSAKQYLLSQSSHELAHPFYWASYVPYGDMAPLRIGRGGKTWWWLGGLLTLFLFGSYYFKIRKHKP